MPPEAALHQLGLGRRPKWSDVSGGGTPRAARSQRRVQRRNAWGEACVLAIRVACAAQARLSQRDHRYHHLVCQKHNPGNAPIILARNLPVGFWTRKVARSFLTEFRNGNPATDEPAAVPRRCSCTGSTRAPHVPDRTHAVGTDARHRASFTHPVRNVARGRVRSPTLAVASSAINRTSGNAPINLARNSPVGFRTRKTTRRFSQSIFTNLFSTDIKTLPPFIQPRLDKPPKKGLRSASVKPPTTFF